MSLGHGRCRTVGLVDIAEVRERGDLHPLAPKAGNDQRVVAEIAVMVLVVVSVAGVLGPQLTLVEPDVVDAKDLAHDRQDQRMGHQSVQLG